jgi:hypothetical protein
MKLRVSPSQLSKFERGVGVPPAEVLFFLKKRSAVSLDWLYPSSHSECPEPGEDLFLQGTPYWTEPGIWIWSSALCSTLDHTKRAFRLGGRCGFWWSTRALFVVRPWPTSRRSHDA